MRLRHHAAVAALAFLVIVSRRPDAILNPQFFAEDGPAWFFDAYQYGGLEVLLLPQAGYLHLLQRLTAAFAVLLPLWLAPLLFNLVAISCQVLVVSLLASQRMAGWAPDLRTRLLIGLAYIGLPGSWETHSILSTAHWHLALLACLLVLAPPPVRLWQKLADGPILAVAVFSGPLSILLLPVAVVSWLRRRVRWTLVVMSIVGVGAITQGTVALLTAGADRSPVPLGATPELLADVVGRQVILGSLIGDRLFSHLPAAIDRSALMVAAFLVGLAVLVYVLWRSPWWTRLFVAFGMMTLAAALVTPLVSIDTPETPQWPQLLMQGVGGRYWLLPKLSFLLALYWMAGEGSNRLAAWTAKALLLLLPVGIAIDWGHHSFPDLEWGKRARAFEAAASGTTMTFPIPPGWTLTLTKR